MPHLCMHCAKHAHPARLISIPSWETIEFVCGASRCAHHGLASRKNGMALYTCAKAVQFCAQKKNTRGLNPALADFPGKRK